LQDDGTKDVLGFHLGPPGQPFHLSNYLLPDEPTMTFQEIQVAEGELPRVVNGVVSRLGYYMTTERS
jgi:hypothetical protein